jgi:hypothetical protein
LSTAEYLTKEDRIRLRNTKAALTRHRRNPQYLSDIGKIGGAKAAETNPERRTSAWGKWLVSHKKSWKPAQEGSD